MAFSLPIRLQDLNRVPTISAEVRKMLTEHPKVYLETELPRCHVSRVVGLSLELNVTCNLKPMVQCSTLTTLHSGHVFLQISLVEENIADLVTEFHLMSQ